MFVAADALEAVAAVVAVALDDPAEWLGAGRRGRCGRRGSRSRRRRCGPLAEVDLDRDVADQPRAGLAHGLEVGEAEARDPLVAELVGVAEQLVAAADGEHDGAVRDRGGERLALASRPCRAATSAGRGPGRRRCRSGRGRRGRRARRARRPRARSRSRATRSGAAGRGCCRGRRRCSSAPGRARAGAAPSGRRLRPAAARSPSRRSARSRRSRSRPRGARPAARPPPRARRRRARRARPGRAPRSSSPSGRRSGAGARSRSARPRCGPRPAGSSRPSRPSSRTSGSGGSGRSSQVSCGGALDERRPRAARRARGRGDAAQQLDPLRRRRRAAGASCIGARTSAEAALAEVELAGVGGLDRVDLEPLLPGAPAQRLEQVRRRGRRAQTSWPAAGEVRGRRGRCRSRGRGPGPRLLGGELAARAARSAP